MFTNSFGHDLGTLPPSFDDLDEELESSSVLHFLLSLVSSSLFPLVLSESTGAKGNTTDPGFSGVVSILGAIEEQDFLDFFRTNDIRQVAPEDRTLRLQRVWLAITYDVNRRPAEKVERGVYLPLLHQPPFVQISPPQGLCARPIQT